MNKNIDSNKLDIANIETPFNPKDVKIDMKTITIDLLIKRIKMGEINLLTDFEKNDNLWSIKKQSQFVESILIRLPLPAFYFDATNDREWIVISGLQRIWALKNFVVDKKLRLQNLEYHQLNGFNFSELPRDLQRRIEETQIVTYQIAEGTPDKVKFNLFKRINTLELSLEPQEIIYAANQGVPADFVKELVGSKEFQEVTKKSKFDKILTDLELVYRFIAFYLNGFSKFNSEIYTFLNESVASLGNLKQSELDIIKNNFIKSLKYSVEIFGENSFKIMPATVIKRPAFNKALFEIVTVTLSKLHDDELEKLTKNNNIKNEYQKLLTNESFNKSITDDTRSNQSVRNRFSKFDDFINKFLKDSNDNTF